MFSFLHMPTTWHCPHSPAAHCATAQQSIDIGPTAANLHQWVCCCGLICWDKQTDKWTDGQMDADQMHRPHNNSNLFNGQDETGEPVPEIKQSFAFILALWLLYNILTDFLYFVCSIASALHSCRVSQSFSTTLLQVFKFRE